MNEMGTRSTSSRRGLAKRVDAERERQQLSVAELAKRAGYSERTIRNFLSGKSVRQNTKLEICQAIGIDLRSEEKLKRKKIKISDGPYGAYAFEHLSSLIGSYFAYRWSFSFPENIVRSLFEFVWDDDENCIQFSENQSYFSAQLQKDVNFNQSGKLYASNRIGLLHLLTSFEGALRLITLSKPQVHDSSMQGIVLTQADKPLHFLPAVSPILFSRTEPATYEELARRVGTIPPEHPEYTETANVLRSIEQNLGMRSSG